MDGPGREPLDVFRDTEYQKRNKFYEAFMFVLVTPDTQELFMNYLRSFDDLHFATGDEILVVVPSLQINGKRALRSDVKDILLHFDSDSNSRDKMYELSDLQTEHSYEFCRYIGLPTSSIPTLVFIEDLSSPVHFVTVSLRDDNRLTFAERIRNILDYLESRCMWREKRELKRIRSQLGATYPATIIQSDTFISLEKLQNDSRSFRERINDCEERILKLDYLKLFRSYLVIIDELLRSKIMPRLDEELINRTEEILSLLKSGIVEEKSMKHLRKIVKSHREHLSEDFHATFDDLVRVSDELLKPERLRWNLVDAEKKILVTNRRLQQETVSERKALTVQRDKLEQEIASALTPVTALSELPSAQLWKLKVGGSPPNWVSGLSLTNHTPYKDCAMSNVGGHKTAILFLASNPKNTDPLRLDEEIREIDSGLRRSLFRERFKLAQKFGVRVEDIRRGLLDERPEIVHFSGHGSPTDSLVCENSQGHAELVPPEALAELFSLCSSYVKCVVLNACYSEAQAGAISKYIPYVVGMTKAIGDPAAVSFAIGFYDAIGAGRSYEDAFRFGKNAINLAGIPGYDIPQLRKMAAT